MKLVLQIAAGIVLGFVLIGLLFSFAGTSPQSAERTGEAVGRFLVYSLPILLLAGLAYVGYRAFRKR